jgi:hypothetical protein
MTNDALARIVGKAVPREIRATKTALRVKLAAAFCIAHHFGWNDDMLNRTALRLAGTN